VTLILLLAIGALARLKSSFKFVAPVEVGASYQTLYFTEKLDHINGDPGIINIKVLLKQGHPNSPLFVYVGGEAPIEVFYTATGILVGYYGPKYNATIAFIEHRYYGESIPNTYSYKYLSTDQALWDFADIVSQLKPQNNTPVVAFGGSYAGMLSAFFRIKYPHLVDGAISSSAPFLMYLDTDGSSFSHIASMDYFLVDRNCMGNVFDGFNILDNFIDRPLQYPALDLIFKTCNTINEMSDVIALEDFLTDAFQTMAQFNYPYPYNIVGTLPAFPVNVSCSIMSQHTQTENMWTTLQGLALIADIFYNSTGQVNCLDTYYDSNMQADPWTYQTCTELLMPYGQYGLPNDMFPSRPWSLNQFSQQCMQTFGVSPRLDWEPVNYGMTANVNSTLKYASNIVFSQGVMDPWSGGCIQDEINANTLVIKIAKAAHCFDLKSPSPRDPLSLILARQQEEILINQWIGSKLAMLDR